MATCIRCGTLLPDGATTCLNCGDHEEEEPPDIVPAEDEPAPVGTWSSHDDETTPPLGSFPDNQPAAPMRLPAIRIVNSPSERPMPTLRASLRADTDFTPPADLTPIPAAAVALALVEDPETRSESEIPSASESHERAGLQLQTHADVLVLRPEDLRTVSDSVSADENAAFTEPPPKPPKPATLPPPILASELLRAGETPSEPGGRTLRALGIAFGGFGAVGTILLGGLDAAVLATGLVLLAVGGICLAPLSYRTRAALVVGVAVIGMGVATYTRIALGADMTAPLLALATMTLAGGLLLRAFYFGSRLARGTVVLGIIGLLLWFFATGGLSQLTHLDVHWTNWLPVVMKLGFAILVLLSLLAFMDGSTGAGARAWAAALLTWYSLHIGVRLAISYAEDAATLPDPLAGVTLSNAALVVLGGIATAQLLASLLPRDRPPVPRLPIRT